VAGLGVKVDARVFLRAMKGAERQTPYAQAKALTATAKDAQTVVRYRLDDDLTIRTHWIARGIRIRPATKTNLSAEVGSVDYFMLAQGVGGKRAAKSDHGIAVPMVGRGLPRATIKSTTRPSRWPGALMQKKRSIFIGDPFGTGTEGLWEKVVKGRGKARKPGLRLLYSFVDEAQIPERWHLLQTVEEVVAERWFDHAESAIREALDTAK